jgi:hypothetical protein
MTRLDARSGKQGSDGTTGGDSEAGRVAGAGRRTEEGGASVSEAAEQGQHPNRIDGSENPDSGDAALENHESGVWNKEREAEEAGGAGLDDRDEKV